MQPHNARTTTGEASDGETLDTNLSPKQEIERKWVVKLSDIPTKLLNCPQQDIMQGYLAIMEDGTEVRLRKKGEEYLQTVKTGKGVSRSESEITLTQEQFEALWSHTTGMHIEKRRFKIPYEGHTIELDMYYGDLEGLMTAEVEFQSLSESEQFTPPSWFGEEKTDDKRYKNQSLALHGIPSV